MKPIYLRGLAIGLCFWSLPSAAAPAALQWPSIEAPLSSRIELVAAETVLNGLRSRMVRIEVPDSMETTLRHFRDRLGAQRVENQIKDARVLAAPAGDFFQTLHITSRGPERTEVVLMTTAVAAGRHKSPVMSQVERWLPADSRLVQTSESKDAGHKTVLVVASNAQPMASNRQYLMAQLRQAGFAISREEPARVPLQAGPVRGGVAIWAERGAEEATVTVMEMPSGSYLTIQRSSDAK